MGGGSGVADEARRQAGEDIAGRGDGVNFAVAGVGLGEGGVEVDLGGDVGRMSGGLGVGVTGGIADLLVEGVDAEEGRVGRDTGGVDGAGFGDAGPVDGKSGSEYA
jgi:hypothetical protein